MRIRTGFIMLIFVLLNSAAVFPLDGVCRVQAEMTVKDKLAVEAELPPALHQYSVQGLDISVTGPEGKPKPFELYWRVKKSVYSYAVKEDSAQLLKDGVYRWEGKPEKPGNISVIKAYLSTADYVAKVDVYGLSGGTWKELAKNAALYKVDGRNRAEIRIKPGEYGAFRLDFISYDEKYRQKPAPVEAVEAAGEKEGTDYAEQSLISVPGRADDDVKTLLTTTLPGSGIRVRLVNIFMEEPFVGEWKLEQEVINSGKREYENVDSGVVENLNSAAPVLRIELDRVLKGRNLRAVLKPKKYIGQVRKWETIARVPRLVFMPDSTLGKYIIGAGCGEPVAVLEEPSADRLRPMPFYRWGKIRQNPDWKPENLVEKYKIGGGPFSSRWYDWEAGVDIKEPGYYRVVLNQAASLGGYYGALRVVKNAKQVPYFVSAGERVEVPFGLNESYDSKKNISTWVIELPRASEAWGDLLLEAEGIFSRKLTLETQNGGALAWEQWREEEWSSSKNKKTELRIPLNTSSQGTLRIKLTMEHGDNSRIPIIKASAFYSAPAICFIADTAGPYVLYGGNQDAKAPQYDMNLVQDALLTQEPKPASMGECRAIASPGVRIKFFKLFEGTSLGLYIALGIVTLILIIIIARLFPAVENKRKK